MATIAKIDQNKHTHTSAQWVVATPTAAKWTAAAYPFQYKQFNCMKCDNHAIIHLSFYQTGAPTNSFKWFCVKANADFFACFTTLMAYSLFFLLESIATPHISTGDNCKLYPWVWHLSLSLPLSLPRYMYFSFSLFLKQKISWCHNVCAKFQSKEDANIMWSKWNICVWRPDDWRSNEMRRNISIPFAEYMRLFNSRNK